MEGRNDKIMHAIDYSKSLEQLENDYWGDPTYDSYVVVTCHTMRKKPLLDLTIEEIRLVIGQGLSLDYLMPMAIKIVQENILAEGDCFEGDLLSNMLSENTFSYWRTHKEKWNIIFDLYNHNESVFESKAFKIMRTNFDKFKMIHN